MRFKRLLLYVCAGMMAYLLTACVKSGETIDLLEDIEQHEDINPLDDIEAYETLAERGTLTIATVYFHEDALRKNLPYNKILIETRRMFVEKYPGWTVEIVPEEEGDPDQTIADRYSEELPNRLRDANGPDIVAMASSEAKRYVAEELLQDMLQLNASDAENALGNLLPGIRMLVSDENGLYCMPTSFSFNVLAVNLPVYEKNSSSVNDIRTSVVAERKRGGLQTWEDIAAFFKPEIEKLKVKYLLPFTPQQLVYECFLQNNYASIYDIKTHTYHFDNPVFKEMMQTAYDLHKQGLLPNADNTEIISQNDLNWILVSMSLMDTAILDYDDFSSMSIREFIQLPNFPGTDGFAVQMMEEFAISANAPEKAAAWEFMKLLWSPELQNSNQMAMQPIISEVSEEYVRRAAYTAFSEIPEEAIGQYSDSRLKFFSKINREYGTLGAPPIQDTLEKNMARYFLDEITMDEMINDVNHYIENVNLPE